MSGSRSGPPSRPLDRALAAAICFLMLLAAGCDAGTTQDGNAVGASDSPRPAAESPGEPAAAPDEPLGLGARVARVKQILRTNVDAGVLPGAVVVVREGQRSRAYAYGLANLESRGPVTTRHRFPIASITKSMTATVVMQLVAEGKLALDDPVGRWLGQALPHARAVTIEQLLSHGSGLPEIDDGPLLTMSTATPQDALAQIAARPLEYPPGSTHTYRNANFVVLGLVVQAVTGEPFARTLERAVLRRAGLTHAAIRGRAHQAPPLVTGYADGVAWSMPDLSYAAPAGDVTATARDVSDFFEALFDHELLGARYVREMTRVRAETFSPWGAYALGLAVRQTDCGPVLGHEGRLPGFASMAWTNLATHRSVVLLTNTGARSVEGTFSATLEFALCG